MKTLRFWCLSSTAIVALAIGTYVTAQEKNTETTKSAEKKAVVGAPAVAKGKKATNRLPANFGKLGLSPDQRKRLFAVQDTYEMQIDDLEAKLKELKEKRDAEYEGILLPDQAKQLADIRAAAKKKAEDKKAADKPNAGAAAPVAAPVEKKPEAPKK
jgi:hypothetical protein